jgi:uncharacterized protein (TIGR02246 family)
MNPRREWPAHEAAAELLGAYAGLELPPETAREVERHVAACTECRRALELQRAVRDRLGRERNAAVPVELRDRIFRTLGGGTARPRLARWWWPITALAAVLAGVLVASPWNGAPSAPRSPAAGRASDSAAILGLIQAHAAAWNRRDAKAAAAALAPDAVWVTSGGQELHGRAEIERAHAEWLAQDSAAGASTHVHPPSSISIRFLRPDVAVADLDGQFVAGGRVREQARIFVVATRDAGAWHIAQLRNLRRETQGPSPR